MLKNTVQWIVRLALVLITAYPGLAAPLLTESFTYPDGDLIAAPGSIWTRFSGTTPPEIRGGQLRLTGGNSADVSAPLEGGPYPSHRQEPLYASFRLQATSTPGVLGTFFAHFFDSASAVGKNNATARIWISSTNSVNGGALGKNQFRLGIGNGANAQVTSGQWPTTLFANSNYFVVIRYVPATGLSTLWINPGVESDFGVTAADHGTVILSNSINVDAWAFRQSPGMGVLQIDDLRVGASFSEVDSDNSLPRIHGLPPRVTLARDESSSTLAFTIFDGESAPSALHLSARSSNPQVLPQANVFFGGSGSNRTVILKPAQAAQGIADIDILVTDESGVSSRETIRVAVGVPTIAPLKNVIVPINTPIDLVNVEVDDTEGASALQITVASSNRRLLPNEGIRVLGDTAHRQLQLAPMVGVSGLSTVTVFVSDGTTIVSNQFILSVSPQPGWVITDDFGYPDGPLIGVDPQWNSNGGLGGTNRNEMRMVDQQLLLTQRQSEDVNVSLLAAGQPDAYAPTSAMVFYASFLLRVAELPTGSGGFFAHFAETDSSGYRSRLFLSAGPTGSGKYHLSVANAGGTSAAATRFPMDLETQAVHRVVLRYAAGTGESRLWIDPNTEKSTSIDAGDEGSPGGIRLFVFRQTDGIGTFRIDHLTIGTSFPEVTPAGVRLSVTSNRAGHIEVRWPSEPAGYLLESSSSLIGGWRMESAPGEILGSERRVVIESVTGARFFRLIRP